MTIISVWFRLLAHWRTVRYLNIPWSFQWVSTGLSFHTPSEDQTLWFCTGKYCERNSVRIVAVSPAKQTLGFHFVRHPLSRWIPVLYVPSNRPLSYFPKSYALTIWHFPALFIVTCNWKNTITLSKDQKINQCYLRVSMGEFYSRCIQSN